MSEQENTVIKPERFSLPKWEVLKKSEEKIRDGQRVILHEIDVHIVRLDKEDSWIGEERVCGVTLKYDGPCAGCDIVDNVPANRVIRERK